MSSKPNYSEDPKRPPTNSWSGDEIVISGMSGIFPNSDNTKDFMENLYNKVDMVSDYDGDLKSPEVPRHVGKIDGTTKFDAQFFKVTYNQAISMEPMMRKLMEQMYCAIYDSGANPVSFKGQKVGVIVGSNYMDCGTMSLYNAFRKNVFGISGACKAMFSNRISYWLDSKGPSYALDCNCSSSLVALQHAYQAMKTGVIDAAIVCGSSLCIDPKLALNLRLAGFVCLDGKTKCFDKNSDGFVRASAINVIFLQRARDAKRIYAEVYHSKMEYGLKDGVQFSSLRKTKDLEDFLEGFYSETDISPETVEYVEGHGEAKAESDAYELEAIGKVFAKNKTVKVGCVKSNMGNSESTSGLCAVTKVCLAYHTGQLASNLHYTQPLDIPSVRDGKVQVLEDHAPFNRGFAAINNFAFSGANVHILLKGHFKKKDPKKYVSGIPSLVLISGRNQECVDHILGTLEKSPQDPEMIGLIHNVYQTETPGHNCRGYTILDYESQEPVCLAKSVEFHTGIVKPLWLVFSGMGSQWPGMGADLMRIPTFAAAIEKCNKALEPKGVDIVKIITDPDKNIFSNIIHSFVGIAAVQIGLIDILKEMGIVPDNIIGHSVGELGCSYFEGSFTTEEMILAAYSRGLVSNETPLIRGSMAAVGLGYKDILPLCPPEIDVACHNSSESATISGPADVMKDFVADLKSRGVFAREVPCSDIAYHSRYIADAGPALLHCLRKVIKNPKPRSEKWISTSVPQERWFETIAKYSSAEYHTNNLLSPVHFEESSRLIPPDAVVVEVAPHGLLQAILKRSHSQCQHIPLTRRGEKDPVKFFLNAIGRLYQEGFCPKVNVLYPKIEFPVSTETSMISHLVHFEHSENWPESVYINRARVLSKARDLVLSIHDDEHKYLSDHIREGVNVYPEAAILFFVWETLAMYNGVNYRNMSVWLKNVHFKGRVVIFPEEPLKLKLLTSKGCDKFEVTLSDMVVAFGEIAEIKKNITAKLPTETLSDETFSLNSEDVYRTMFMRNYQYKNEFQSIYSINSRHDNAKVKWTGNWVTFLDSLLQLNMFVRDYDGVSKPKTIESIYIDIKEHNTETKLVVDGQSCFNVQHNSVCRVTRCAGVVIRNITFDEKLMHKVDPDIIRTLSFVPHYSFQELNIYEALQINLQIIVENTSNTTIKAIDFASFKTPLTNMIKRVSKSTPKLDIEINISQNKKLSEETNYDLIIIHKDFCPKLVIEEMFNYIDCKTFVILLAAKRSFLVNEKCFDIVTAFKVHKQNLFMLKKVNTVKSEICVNMNIGERYDWMPESQTDLEKNKRRILASGALHYGYAEMVRSIRRRQGNAISLSMADVSIQRHDNTEIVQKQLGKNLALNVFKEGQWGGYYYINMLSKDKVSNVRLTTKSVGEIDSLTWEETPVKDERKNLILVHYAGPSAKDARNAVGINDDDTNSGFGMDFSGIDCKGNRVMGLISNGALSSTIESNDELIWPVPDHWSLEEAATVPLPYVHAYYCLTIKGQLRRGQSVFVNGGAGALGQAVISLSLSIGCEVYTTVSDVEKKEILLKLFPNLKERNIGFSRTDNFHNMVISNSQNKRCDFVISSASGAIRKSAMKCVGFHGFFLDVNDHDVLQNQNLGMFYLEEDRSYFFVKLNNIFLPENAKDRKMLQIMLSEGIATGVVRPLSRVVYSPADVTRAFRFLSSSGHRGRVLINMENIISPKNKPKIVPRMKFSSVGTYIVVCDDSYLGIELADHLVRHGARNLIINLKFEKVTGYVHYKILLWRKFGASAVLSTESLETEHDCITLLKKFKPIHSVKGLFIIQQLPTKNEIVVDTRLKNVSVLKNLDAISRNNLLNLQYFVVILNTPECTTGEMESLEAENICQNRCELGLPALVLKLPSVLEFNASYSDENSKFQPQTMYTLFTALEISLKHQWNSVLTYNLKNRKNNEVSDKISKILRINNIYQIDDTLTIRELILNEINLEEIKTVLNDGCQIHFADDQLLDTTISEIRSAARRQVYQSNKFDSGVGAFYSFLDPVETTATDPLVAMRTLLDNAIEETSIWQTDPTSSFLLMIPGFEGHYKIFEHISERLKILSVTCQMGPDMRSDSVQDMAVSMLKAIKKSIRLKKRFYLFGYSFGVNIALEMADLLEKEGHVGTVFCLDSSPDALRAQLDAYVGNMSKTQLQNTVVEFFNNLLSGSKGNDLSKQIEVCTQWSQKIEVCVNNLKKSVTFTHQYLKDVIDTAYKRLDLARNYKPDLKLNSKLVLIKGISHPKMEKLADDYNLSCYSKQPVEVFDIPSDHATSPQDCRVSNIVNKLLDPEILDEFRKNNMCQSYLMDPFMSK